MGWCLLIIGLNLRPTVLLISSFINELRTMPEILVETGVDDGIQCAVSISQVCGEVLKLVKPFCEL